GADGLRSWVLQSVGTHTRVPSSRPIVDLQRARTRSGRRQRGSGLRVAKRMVPCVLGAAVRRTFMVLHCALFALSRRIVVFGGKALFVLPNPAVIGNDEKAAVVA
ncbi:unnamed protein product, partial [Ectocarpus sp. 4 AP-2014]